LILSSASSEENIQPGYMLLKFHQHNNLGLDLLHKEKKMRYILIILAVLSFVTFVDARNRNTPNVKQGKILKTEKFEDIPKVRCIGNGHLSDDGTRLAVSYINNDFEKSVRGITDGIAVYDTAKGKILWTADIQQQGHNLNRGTHIPTVASTIRFMPNGNICILISSHIEFKEQTKLKYAENKLIVNKFVFSILVFDSKGKLLLKREIKLNDIKFNGAFSLDGKYLYTVETHKSVGSKKNKSSRIVYFNILTEIGRASCRERV